MPDEKSCGCHAPWDRPGVVHCPLHAAAGQMAEALEKCEGAIRRMAQRLDKEPGNQMVVGLWLRLADNAQAALAAAGRGK